MSKWISVKDRLPERETNVLLWQKYYESAPYASVTIGHLHQPGDLRRKPYWLFIAYGGDMVHPKVEDYHRAEFICPGSEFVTHWMPLPKPPGEMTVFDRLTESQEALAEFIRLAQSGDISIQWCNGAKVFVQHNRQCPESHAAGSCFLYLARRIIRPTC